MKKLILLLLMMIGGAPILKASDGCEQHLTREEFREKQKAYIIERVKLTEEEADKFFPIYFELQGKKKELNDRVWELLRQGEDENISEAQFDSIMEGVYDARIASNRLEKTYYAKFRKILSAKKVYEVQKAEMHFHRDLLKQMGKERGGKAPQKAPQNKKM